MPEETQSYEMSASDVEQRGLGPDIALPQDRYQVCCVAEELTKSASGNTMIVQTWEIVGYEVKNPDTGQFERRETIRWGANDLTIKGTKLKAHYLVTLVLDENKNVDKVKTSKSFQRLVDIYTKLGVMDSPDEKLDLSNPPLRCRGIVADAICGSEEYTMRRSPTPEQISKGIKMGDEITDADGRPIKGNSAVLKMILKARSDYPKTEIPF